MCECVLEDDALQKHCRKTAAFCHSLFERMVKLIEIELGLAFESCRIGLVLQWRREGRNDVCFSQLGSRERRHCLQAEVRLLVREETK